MFNRYKLLTFSLLLWTIFLLVASQSPTSRAPKTPAPKIITSNHKETLHIPHDHTLHFTIDLSKFNIAQDLAISVISLDETAPHAFCSKSSEPPTSSLTADYVITTRYSGGTLFIPKAELTDAKEISLTLSCLSKNLIEGADSCDAELNVEPSKEITLDADGKLHEFSLQKLEGATSLTVKLTVPKEDVSIERLVISAQAVGTKEDIEPFIQFYLNKGDEIPSSEDAERAAVEPEQDDKALVLTKDSKLFCTDCTYTLSIKLQQSCILRIQAKAFTKSNEIWKRSYTDVLPASGENYYTVTIDQKLTTEDFVIYINPFQGRAVVHVSCDVLPSNQDNYRWKQIITKPEDLVIYSGDLKSCDTQVFYVLVLGEEGTIYTIGSHFKETSRLQIGVDLPITGDILAGQQVDEELVVPLNLGEKIIITLETASKLNITLINCQSYGDCPGLKFGKTTQAKISHASELPQTDFEYEVQDSQRGKTITIDPHKNGCVPLLVLENVGFAYPVCAYVIRLSSQDDNRAEYSLTARLEGHQYLMPGIPKMGTGAINETDYFILSVPHHNVSQVSFQLTLISGDAILYVSRKEKYPVEVSNNAFISFEGRLIFKHDPKKKEDLAGIYYIGVHAYQSTSYVLSSTVVGAGSKALDYALELTEGVPEKAVLFPKHENPELFFKAKVDLPKDWVGTIRVALVPVRGKLILAASSDDDVIPDVDQPEWRVNTNYLKIQSSDKNFKRKGYYHFGVFLDWLEKDSYLLEDITFTIAYSLAGNSPSLDAITTPGEEEILVEGDNTIKDGQDVQQPNVRIPMIVSNKIPYHGEVQFGQFEFFKAFIRSDEEYVTVYKESDTGSVDLFLSLTSENQFPDLQNYDYTTMVTQKDHIMLNKDDIAKACKNSSPDPANPENGCEIYFSVIKTWAVEGGAEEHPVGFIIRLRTSSQGHTYTQLQNGREYQVHIRAEDNPVLFETYPTPGYDIQVYVQSASKANFSIYANNKNYQVKPDEGYQSTLELNFPTPNNHSYASKNTGEFSYLTIPAAKQHHSTVTTVAVYFDQNAFSSLSKKGFLSFSIVISSDRQQIASGKDIVGLVNSGKYNYYEINIHRDVCTLLITLTPFDFGDAEVFVSYNPHKIPIHNSHHNFNSMSRHRAHMLEINFQDLFLKPQMQGIWIIGVYGKAEETRYSLSVTYETVKKLTLNLEQSLDMYVKANSTLYAEYTHTSPDSFYLRIDKQSGDVTAYIRPLKEGEFYVNYLPNATSYNWKFTSKEGTWIKIDKNDAGFCSPCVYLIAVQAVQASKIVMSAYYDFDRFRIESSLSYAESLPPQQLVKYNIFPESYFNIDLVSGQIKFYFVDDGGKAWKNYSLSVTRPVNSMVLHYHFKAGYVVFENTGNEPANFTFASESKDLPTFLVLERYHHTILNSYETKPFVYYNSFKNETILLTVRFCFEEPKNHFSMFNSTSKSPSSLKLKRLLLSVKFWGNLVSSGLRHSDDPDAAGFMVDYFEDFPDKGTRKVCAVQTNTVYGKEGAGRYELALFNPYHYNLNASLYVHTSKTSLSTYNKNEAYFGSLTNERRSIHNIHLLKQESWYYNVLVCSGTLQVSFANNTNALETKPKHIEQLSAGQSMIYTTLSPNFETIFTQLESLKQSSSYLVRSTRFHEDQVIPYQKLPQPDPLDYEFFYSHDDSTLRIFFKPLVWQVTNKPTEQVLYRVKLCPKNEPHTPMEDYCKVAAGCHFMSYSGLAGDRDTTSVVFTAVDLGDFSVSILVSVAHNEATVYSFVYPTLDVSLRIPIIQRYTNSFIYVGCGLLVSFVTLLLYKKIRNLEIVKRWMDDIPIQKYGEIIDEKDDL